MYKRLEFLSAVLCCAMMPANDDMHVGAVEEEMNSLLGMEDLEDMSFDDIEDVPEFVLPPEGTYAVYLDKAGIEEYTNKEEPLVKKKRLSHLYKVHTTYELSKPDEKAPKEGDMFNERWQLTPDGLKYWKARAKSILGEERTTGQRVGTILTSLNEGAYLLKVKISHRDSKGKDGKTYTNLQMRVVGLINDGAEAQM